MLIFPVIVGYGKGMFAEGITPTGLSLINSKISPSGITINRHTRTSQFPVGTVGGVEAP